MTPTNRIIWDSIKGELWFAAPLTLISYLECMNGQWLGIELVTICWLLWLGYLAQEVHIALLTKLLDLRDVPIEEEK